MNTPVLLVIYKRPDLTLRALDVIAGAKPSLLLVAADGPRTAAEAIACETTRAAVKTFAGDCEVLTSFSDTNLGCGVRVYTAISWALSLCEEVIILEDDCLPNASFFRFCEEMLRLYRDDERVMHISGDNFVGPAFSGPFSYYFSKYTHASGWATWRRAWRHFDWTIERWPELKAAGLLDSVCGDPYERRYWMGIYDRLCHGDREVWDLQWNLAMWSQAGLAVLPSVNLVLNDGWGPDATHSKAPLIWPEAVEMGAICHPPYVVRNVVADTMTFEKNFGGAEMRATDSPRARIRRAIDPILGPGRTLKRMVRRIALRG
jgi:hypothetical protein